MSKKHAFATRLRAFRIWQQLGYNPWEKPRDTQKQRSRDFYKGAFSSIPFFNDEGKRTFTHLLLRPGYMIRDYVNGAHDRFMAPLTALIFFYAFLTLVTAILQPIHQYDKAEQETVAPADPEAQVSQDAIIKMRIRELYEEGEKYLELDQHPELVNSRTTGIIAAVQGSVRSKGITMFLENFILLWLAMGICLRRYKVTMSAAAAAAAYSVCVFSFLLFFTVIITLGARESLGVSVLFLLLIVIYRQWFSISWIKSTGLALLTALLNVLIFALIRTVLIITILLTAYLRGDINFLEYQ